MMNFGHNEEKICRSPCMLSILWISVQLYRYDYVKEACKFISTFKQEIGKMGKKQLTRGNNVSLFRGIYLILSFMKICTTLTGPLKISLHSDYCARN